MFTNQFNDELDWAAFCYAAGDLTPAEAEQFELRLATEQPAREALARAVELTQAVAVAESQPQRILVSPAAGARKTWITRLSWMAVGGLASLLVALLWSNSFTGKSTTASREVVAEQSALAAAWQQAGDEMASAKDDGLWTAVASTEMDDVPASIRGDDLALEETPSWMTAAVQGLAGMSPDDTDAGDDTLVND